MDNADEYGIIVDRLKTIHSSFNPERVVFANERAPEGDDLISLDNQPEIRVAGFVIIPSGLEVNRSAPGRPKITHLFDIVIATFENKYTWKALKRTISHLLCEKRITIIGHEPSIKVEDVYLTTLNISVSL